MMKNDQIVQKDQKLEGSYEKFDLKSFSGLTMTQNNMVMA